KLDVVLDVAEAGQGLGDGGTETLFLHWILPLRGAGIRRSVGDQFAIWRWKTARQWLLSATKRGSITLSVLRGQGRSMSTKSATRVGRPRRGRATPTRSPPRVVRRVSSRTWLASCTASSRSCETSSVVVLVFMNIRC